MFAEKITLSHLVEIKSLIFNLFIQPFDSRVIVPVLERAISHNSKEQDRYQRVYETFQQARNIMSAVTKDDAFRQATIHARQLIHSRREQGEENYISHIARKEENYLVFNPYDNDPDVQIMIDKALPDRTINLFDNKNSIGIIGRVVLEDKAQWF